MQQNINTIEAQKEKKRFIHAYGSVIINAKIFLKHRVNE